MSHNTYIHHARFLRVHDFMVISQLQFFANARHDPKRLVAEIKISSNEETCATYSFLKVSSPTPRLRTHCTRHNPETCLPAGFAEPVPVDKGGQVRRPLREAAHQRDHGQPEGNTAWCHALLSSHRAWAIEECQWPAPLWPSAKESRGMGRSKRHVLVLLWHWYSLLKYLRL